MQLSSISKEELFVNDIAKKLRDYPDSAKNELATSFRAIKQDTENQFHFINELIQNAEDQEASKVKFLVTTRELWFFHNGLELSLTDKETADKDIRGFARVISSKSTDASKKGYFGRGFKSVYTICKEPKIISGNFSFRIKTEEEDIKESEFSDARKTIMLTYPRWELQTEEEQTMISNFFNKEEKITAIKLELKKGQEITLPQLREIKDTFEPETLIFLDNIQEVEFKKIADGAIDFDGYIKKTKTSDVEFTITDSEDTKQTFRIFLDPCKITDELFKDMEEEQCKKLTALQKKKGGIPVQILIADNLSNGTPTTLKLKKQLSFLFSYFPLERYTDNYGFVVNAPFNLVSNREGLQPNCEYNAQLLAHCAKLLKLVLSQTDNTFKPKVISELSRMYKSEDATILKIYESIKENLKDEPIFEIENGSFVSAKEAYWVSEDTKWLIPEIVNTENLEKTGRFKKIIRDPDIYEFACQMGAEELSASFIFDNLQKNLESFGGGYEENLARLIFLAKVHKQLDNNKIKDKLQSLPIPSNLKNKINKPFFLGYDTSARDIIKLDQVTIPLVADSFMDKLLKKFSNNQRSALYEALGQIGLPELTPQKMEEYLISNFPKFEEHEHCSAFSYLFLLYASEQRFEPPTKKIMLKTAEGILKYPSELYQQDETLLKYRKDCAELNLYFISPDYAKTFTKIQPKYEQVTNKKRSVLDFRNFLKKLGCHDRLKIKDVPGLIKKSKNTELKTEVFYQVSKYWKQLDRDEREFFEQNPDSFLSLAWIPGEDSKLYAPSEKLVIDSKYNFPGLVRLRHPPQARVDEELLSRLGVFNKLNAELIKKVIPKISSREEVSKLFEHLPESQHELQKLWELQIIPYITKEGKIKWLYASECFLSDPVEVFPKEVIIDSNELTQKHRVCTSLIPNSTPTRHDYYKFLLKTFKWQNAYPSWLDEVKVLVHLNKELKEKGYDTICSDGAIEEKLKISKWFVCNETSTERYEPDDVFLDDASHLSLKIGEKAPKIFKLPDGYYPYQVFEICDQLDIHRLSASLPKPSFGKIKDNTELRKQINELIERLCHILKCKGNANVTNPLSGIEIITTTEITLIYTIVSKPLIRQVETYYDSKNKKLYSTFEREFKRPSNLGQEIAQFFPETPEILHIVANIANKSKKEFEEYLTEYGYLPMQEKLPETELNKTREAPQNPVLSQDFSTNLIEKDEAPVVITQTHKEDPLSPPTVAIKEQEGLHSNRGSLQEIDLTRILKTPTNSEGSDVIVGTAAHRQFEKIVGDDFTIRHRSVKRSVNPEKKQQIKEYLKRVYSGHCQFCDKYAFTREDGTPYFDVHNLLSQKKATVIYGTIIENESTSLCVCPTHHAKLEVLTNDFSNDAGIKKIINTAKQNGDKVTSTVRIGNNDEPIFFRADHFSNFKKHFLNRF